MNNKLLIIIKEFKKILTLAIYSVFKYTLINFSVQCHVLSAVYIHVSGEKKRGGKEREKKKV
jgi:hypothetical protein